MLNFLMQNVSCRARAQIKTEKEFFFNFKYSCNLSRVNGERQNVAGLHG